MNAISTATAGLNAATAQLDAAVSQTASPNGDVSKSVMGQIEAEIAFEVNTQVIATADRMIGRLLDITA